MSKKILFVSSQGGHLNELLQLLPLIKKYNSFLVTEKSKNTLFVDEIFKKNKLFFVKQVRKNNYFSYITSLLILSIQSIIIFFKIYPDIIISTGSITAIIFCSLAKIFHKKVIYIETYAAIKKPSIAAKIIYPISNRFYIQWEEMKKFYPKAIYIGSLY